MSFFSSCFSSGDLHGAVELFDGASGGVNMGLWGMVGMIGRRRR